MRHVYRADLAGLAQVGLRWLASLLGGGFHRQQPVSLLDSTPLGELLERFIDFDGIRRGIERGHLGALCITASSYTSGDSISFFQGQESMQPWRRARRVGRRTEFGMLHVLASCALPFLFPPVQIDDEHFGDGSMHQLAPISAALHLGARRVLVIGVGSPGRRDLDAGVSSWPSLAQIAGHMLDTIFIDTLDTDLERLQRVNQTIELIPEELRQQRGFVLHKVESLVIRPTEHLDAIAVAHARELPRTIRLMMRTLGLLDPNGARLLSYLLFERSYCRQLMRLGFADAMALRTRIVDFLDPVRKPGMGERDQIALTQT